MINIFKRAKLLKNLPIFQKNRFPLKNTNSFFSKSPSKKMVNIIFINKDNTEKEVSAEIGQNILEIARNNDIDIEGACEASLACSTCHVIFQEEFYDQLEEPIEEEEDLLDTAYGLTETSRLGCQVIIDEKFEGVKIRLPKATRNFYVDGKKPGHH